MDCLESMGYIWATNGHDATVLWDLKRIRLQRSLLEAMGNPSHLKIGMTARGKRLVLAGAREGCKISTSLEVSIAKALKQLRHPGGRGRQDLHARRRGQVWTLSPVIRP